MARNTSDKSGLDTLFVDHITRGSKLTGRTSIRSFLTGSRAIRDGGGQKFYGTGAKQVWNFPVYGWI